MTKFIRLIVVLLLWAVIEGALGSRLFNGKGTRRQVLFHILGVASLLFVLWLVAMEVV